ncbi:MAG: hypothetical protein ACLFST_04385 [Spirochaetia bacterium]
MNSRIRPASPLFWLQLLAGLFFFFLGLAELLYMETLFPALAGGVSGAFGRGSEELNVVAAILELLGGIVLVVFLFTPTIGKVGVITAVILLVLWLLRVIFDYIFTGFFEPNFVIWFKNFSYALIPAAVLWLLGFGR